MGRYIDADRTSRGLKDEAVRIKSNEVVMRLVDDICIWLEKQPTADVEEVKHAYWVRRPELDDVYYSYCHCSNCGFVANKKHDYCVCGAKMDGGKSL